MARTRKPRQKRTPKPKPPFTVLRDTREQLGWVFAPDEETGCLGTELSTLKTGDYSLAGYESLLCIERKGSTGEFAQNITQKRFENELARLQDFPVRFVLLEFSLEDVWNFPANSGIPRSRWRYLRTTPEFILKRLLELQFQYQTPFILCGHLGKEVALSIMQRVLKGVFTSASASMPIPEPNDDAIKLLTSLDPPPKHARKKKDS